MTYILTNGTESKNINPWDLEGNPEAWTFFNRASQSELEALPYRVAASYRAVNKRAIAAANVPFQLLKGKEVVDDSTKWENKVGFLENPRQLIERTSLSITFTNKAYYKRGKNIADSTKSLNYLVPTTIIEETDPVTGLLRRFVRQVNAETEYFAPDDPNLIKIWRLDHTTELLPSKNTAWAAIANSTGGIYFQDLFLYNFFKGGGVKASLVALKGAVFNERKEEIERGWDRFLKYISKTRAKIINADTMDIKTIGIGPEELNKNETYKQAIENIALGIGMPVSELMSDFDSFATAQVDRMQWQRDDVFPLVNFIADEWNKQIFQPMGLHWKFMTETTDSETKGEADRAKAYETYVSAGIMPSIAAQIVSIELPQGIEYIDLDKMADKKKQEEADKQKQEMDKLQAQQQATPPTEAPKTPPVKWIPSIDEFKEMRVWEKAALQRLRRSETLDFDYRPHYGGLPDDVSGLIVEALARATTPEEIRAAFEIDLDPVTQTPAPEYKTSEIILLADALNNLAAKSMTETPQQPIVIVNNTKKEKRKSMVEAFAKSAFAKRGVINEQPNPSE